MDPLTKPAPNHITTREPFERREGVGTLLIIGGGETPRLIHEEFFRLAGGPGPG